MFVVINWLLQMKEQDKDVLLKLGLKIKELRTQKGYTQLQLSTDIGIEKTNLSRIERGLTNPTFISLLNIAIALNIPVKELVDI